MLRAVHAVWLFFSQRLRLTAAISISLLLGGGAVLAASQKADIRRMSPHSITVTATPIEFDRDQPQRRDFGRLIWRGGVDLRSQSTYFGGYSGLTLDATGNRLLTVSDSGSWLSAHIDYSGNSITGLSDVQIGPITQKDGKPLQDRHGSDAESIDAVAPDGGADGHYLISFEGRHRVEEYVFQRGELKGPVGTRPLPANLRRMHKNGGLEAFAVLRGGPHAGAIVMFAERLLTPRGGDHTGAIVIGGKASPLKIARVDEFDITEAKSLQDGSLLLLERSFNTLTFRLDIRLRLIPAAEIQPGGRLVGVELLRAGPNMQIDNFEGLAVSRGPQGETLITLISDNNFNFMQRTLLVQFELKQ